MEKKKVFVIMPFADEFFEVYEMLKMQFSDGFEFSNAADEANQQNILKDIVQPIYETDIVIADLTGLNANVMYELALAHAFNKKTIVITQDDLATLPFDLKQYRAKNYTIHFKKFAELVDYLNTNLNGAINGTVSYSNPVKDFLAQENIKDVPWFSEQQAIVLKDESDKGFIDFLADIEANTEQLTDTINNMSQDMQDMSVGVNDSTVAIRRVNQTGGNGNAAFVRKESRKVARHIDQFSQKLREHNKSIAQLWDEIEKNSLGLLENQFATRNANRENLIAYLLALYSMKNTIATSNPSVENLKSIMEGNLGLERSMNQAIRFVVSDLTTYITETERIQSSIDKILAKSKYVVGELDTGNC